MMEWFSSMVVYTAGIFSGWALREFVGMLVIPKNSRVRRQVIDHYATSLGFVRKRRVKRVFGIFWRDETDHELRARIEEWLRRPLTISKVDPNDSTDAGWFI